MNGRDDMFLGITSEVSESSKHAGMISPVTFSCMSIGLHGGGGQDLTRLGFLPSEYVEERV